MGQPMPVDTEMVLTRLRCKRCGHRWIPRIEIVRICPRCKSARWDTPRGPRR